MKLLPAIAPENQLLEVLDWEQVPEKAIEDKINFVSTNIHRVLSVNGRRVFNPCIDGDTVCYNFKNLPGRGERKYYHPIRFAEIIFKD